jgi:hypothetical protein
VVNDGCGCERKGALATAGGTPALRLDRAAIPMALEIAGYAESVVGVLEIWRDAGAGGAASDFNVMAPRSSAGGFALRLHRALLRAARVALGRDCVVVGVVPVAAPLVNVVADIVKAERVRGVSGDRFRAGLPARGIVWHRLRRIVSPWKLLLFEAAAGGVFPFSFGRKAEGTGCLRGQPFAIAGGFMPGDSRDGLPGVVEIRILRERRWQSSGCEQEALILGVRDLRRGHEERIDPYAMDGTFAILAGV